MKDLETFGDKLKKISKANPFRVPDGYFESLPSKVQNFCKEQAEKEQPINWVLTLKTQLALAAGICFFVLLALTGYYYSKQVHYLSPLHGVNYIKILEESGTEFDEIQLYEFVNPGTKKDSIKKPVNDELIEYLLYNNIDNGTLLEHSKEIKP